MEEFDEDYIFEKGDMVLLTLTNGGHYVGEFACMDDLGVQIFLESKTEWTVGKIKKVVRDKDFRTFVENRVNDRLKSLTTDDAWMDLFCKYFNEPLDKNIDEYDLKDAVRQQVYQEEEAVARKLWGKPIIEDTIVEEDVTKPYLKMLKKPVRTLVTWSKIDEMCSATELAEDAEIKNFAESLENGDFQNMIDKLKDEGK